MYIYLDNTVHTCGLTSDKSMLIAKIYVRFGASLGGSWGKFGGIFGGIFGGLEFGDEIGLDAVLPLGATPLHILSASIELKLPT